MSTATELAQIKPEERTLVTRPALGDDEVEPRTRYSSSEIIIAAEEMKFRMKEAKRKSKKGGKKAQDELNKAYTTTDHELTVADLCRKYKVELDKGLSSQQVTQLQEEYGRNELTPPYQKPWWRKLLESIFGGFFNVLLWLGSILCFIAFGVDPNTVKDQTNLYLGIVLAVVVTLTGIFGYFQESKSDDLMEGLSRMLPPDVIVLRDGEKVGIQPTDLVPGDLVELVFGMSLPADIRFVECTPDTQVDNSSLTGESEPQTRKKAPSTKVPAEAENLAFFGTLIVRGKGIGLIINTGDNTFMGRTAQLASETENEATPIAKEIKAFVLKVSLIAFALGISFFAIGMAANGDIVKNVIFLIGIIVANVPEGLLATVTVSLTLTAKRMFTKNVKVKNLESVETLGSTSVICSDKTGTLTTNVMTCYHVYYDLQERVCQTDNPMEALIGDFYIDGKPRDARPSFLRLIRCAALCNNASFLNTGELDPRANATEAAMVKFSFGHINSQYRMSVRDYRKQQEKLHEIPFNSANKWQVSIHSIPPELSLLNDDEKSEDHHAAVVFKGAPERVLAMCTHYLLEGVTVDMTEEIREQVMAGVMSLGEQGERVLALADLHLPSDEYDISREEPPPQLFGNGADQLNEVGPNENIIFVENDGELVRVELNFNNKDGGALEFGEHTVQHVMIGFKEQTEITEACQRLFFADIGSSLDPEDTLGQIPNLVRGSILHYRSGPYKFAGTERENANWAFGRNENELGLVFVGLMAMIDPPRAGVPLAVRKCQSAGIKVIMVTGDHPVTAKAIARQVNIVEPTSVTREDVAKQKYGGDVSRVQEDEYNASVVAGWDLQEKLDGDEDELVKFWNRALNKKNCVFARTSPQQKLLIVKACQDRGGIVAVTGDGVNDSPALKKADIGVAMGITGTEVAKTAADMILLDDNFASIVNGVEEGRIIFDNLKKSIAYTLSSNIPEIAPFLLFQTVFIPLPLSTVMILLVDLGTDLLPAISLAHEGAEADIMERPPRNPKTDNLVTWRLVSFSYLQIGMIQAIAGFYAYFVVFMAFGLLPEFLVGADQYGVFPQVTDKTVQRDAKYFYCFEDRSLKCQYFPDIYSWSASNTQGFDNWLSNDKAYAKNARQLLTDNFANGTNIFMNGTVFVNSWNNGLETRVHNALYTSKLYPTRPCYTVARNCDTKNKGLMGDYYTPEGQISLFPIIMHDRQEALARSNSAYFISIIVVQWADLMICKTRIQSLFNQGMTNTFMNWSLIFETMLGALLVYFPASNTVTGTRPIRFLSWTAGVPFTIFIYCYDEFRKGYIRKHPSCWLQKVTYW